VASIQKIFHDWFNKIYISRGNFFEMLIVIFLLFSWNPAGALRAGKNPAVYKFLGETIHVDGKSVTIYFP
jgi:hypothetical protein